MKFREATCQDRPPRILEIGEIPSTLPSVYDAIDGECGAPSLVSELLLKDFDKWGQDWIGLIDEEPEPNHIYKTHMTFFNAYVYEQKHHNTDWPRVYKKLAILSAQGWLREARAAGIIEEVNEAAIQLYSQALRDHLLTSEQEWGVEWLTSRQPIDTQNDQMMVTAENHRKKYYTEETNGMKYFLAVGGDTLIRQIRLNTNRDTLEGWQRIADHFTW
jgi:hypothetical protein